MRHLLDNHIAIVIALDTIFGSFEETWDYDIFR